MALTYRTGATQLLQTLSSDEQSKVRGKIVTQFKSYSDVQCDISPYVMSTDAMKFLEEMGIPISIANYKVHSHPVCKTIENYFLFSVIPNYVQTNDFMIVSMKESKFKLFTRTSGLSFIDLLNRCVTVKDLVRYPKGIRVLECEGFDVSSDDKDLSYQSMIPLLKKELEDPKRKRKKPLNFFFHDELHYWSKRSLMKFLDLYNPDIIIGTHIYPKELLIGCTKSLCPLVYEFDVIGDNLYFHPDGKRTESYCQPLSGDYLLRAKGLVTAKGQYYTVEVCCTKAAHSLIIIKKGKLLTSEVRMFDQTDAVDLSKIACFGNDEVNSKFVNLSQLNDLFSYLKCLKKADQESGTAKTKQFERHISASTVHFNMEMIKEIIAMGQKSRYFGPSLLDGTMDSLINLIPPKMRKFFRGYKKRRFHDFFSDLGRKVVTIETEVFNFYDSDLLEFEDVELEWSDMISSLRTCQRESQPYSMCRLSFNFDTVRLGSRCSVVKEYILNYKSYCDGLLSDEKFQILSDDGYLYPGFRKLSILKNQGLSREGHQVLYYQFVIQRDFNCSAHRLITWEGSARSRIYQTPRKWKTRMVGLLSDSVPGQELSKGIEANSVEPSVSEAGSVDGRSCSEFDISMLSCLESMDPPAETDPLPQTQLAAEPYMRIEYQEVDESEVERFYMTSVDGDGNCFWHCMSLFTGLDIHEIKELTLSGLDTSGYEESIKQKVRHSMKPHVYADSEVIILMCRVLNLSLCIYKSEENHELKAVIGDGPYVYLRLVAEHYNLLTPKNSCVVNAITEATGWSSRKVRELIYEKDPKVLIELDEGDGLAYGDIESIFTLVGISAMIHVGEDVIEVPGKLPTYSFNLCDNHLEFIERKGSPERRVQPKGSHSTFMPESELVKLRQFNCFNVSPDFDRAKKLYDSFMQETTGVIGRNLLSKYSIEEKDHSCTVTFFVGTFGSGKSRHFIEVAKRNKSREMLIISPRLQLANDIKKKIDNKISDHVTVKTFESALSLLRSRSRLIVIDELQLCPPGYLDLWMLFNPTAHFLVTGDPCQTSYDNEKDRDIFQDDTDDLKFHLKNRKYFYNCQSRRFVNPDFKKRLPCDLVIQQAKGGKVGTSTIEMALENHDRVDCFLVSSFDELRYYKARLTAKKSRTQIMTFGQSTGLTFDAVIVVVSRDSLLCDEARWLVSLSRARETVIIAFSEGLTASNVVAMDPERLISKFLCSRVDAKEYLMNNLPGSPVLIDSFKVGRDEVDREERLRGDPWLKSMICLAQRAEVDEIIMQDWVPEDAQIKSHIPICSIKTFHAIINSHMNAKEQREFYYNYMATNQFSDSFEGRNRSLLNTQADKFESIWMRHKNSDTLTFLMAAKKRIRFSTPNVELPKLLRSEKYGYDMADVFESVVPIRSFFDPDLFEECVNDFEVKKLTKSAATIENHKDRSCADWDLNKVKIFMKSQLCTKAEKMFCEAKAGQTLACFSHIILARFAPYIRYMEKIVLRNLPENLYIHSSKNFDVLNAYVKEHDFSGLCTESDYESFDASQDHVVMAFEIELMRRMNLPQDFISDYIEIKSCLKCKLGDLAIMRHTGEAATFLFNTLSNMVFTFMKYDLTGNETILFAGDDMCMNSNRPVMSKYDYIFSKMTLKAKVTVTEKPMFCGWRLTPYGICKDPSLLLCRMWVAVENGKVQECIDNYAIEASYAYRLSSKLIDIFSEHDMLAHHILIRFIVKNRELIKSNIKALFVSEDGSWKKFLEQSRTKVSRGQSLISHIQSWFTASLGAGRRHY
nr:replicase [Miscanthus virus M]